MITPKVKKSILYRFKRKVKTILETSGRLFSIEQK